MSELLDPILVKTFAADKRRLANTAVTIITVAGTFQEDLKRLYGFPNSDKTRDVVFSRAHFSMAVGVAYQAWQDDISPTKAWVVDPTNYVSRDDWRKIQLTELVGKTLARRSWLKSVKDIIDQFGRQKLPILDSITPPLLHLTEDIEKPILCFHIAAGNILATQGKKVVQVVTDPHVRPEYTTNAHLPNIIFCVFDERTRLEFFEVAAINGVKVRPEKVIVTGPPIDPRIIAARKHKVAWRSGPLQLGITTGGLGTNSYEIRQLLVQLLPHLRREPSPYNLVIYAGTQKDVALMAHQLAKEQHIGVGKDQDRKAKLRILYHPQILDANELLIRYLFPWADGIITKPSGDMAYDAVAAGCFLLTLSEWGIWEERIREIFTQKDIARVAEIESIVAQLSVLQSLDGRQSWVEQAMNHSLGIEKLFLLGSRKILEVLEESPTLFSQLKKKA